MKKLLALLTLALLLASCAACKTETPPDTSDPPASLTSEQTAQSEQAESSAMQAQSNTEVSKPKYGADTGVDPHDPNRTESQIVDEIMENITDQV